MACRREPGGLFTAVSPLGICVEGATQISDPIVPCDVRVTVGRKPVSSPAIIRSWTRAGAEGGYAKAYGSDQVRRVPCSEC